jgi:hypothetical protein
LMRSGSSEAARILALGRRSVQQLHRAVPSDR